MQPAVVPATGSLVVCLGLLLPLVACSPSKVDTGLSGSTGGGSGDSSTGDEWIETRTFEVAWTEDALEVQAFQDGLHDYYFGLCGVAPDVQERWLGESCVLADQLDDGTEIRYCHQLDGGTLRLTYGGSEESLSVGETAVSPEWEDTTMFLFFGPDWRFDEAFGEMGRGCYYGGRPLCGGIELELGCGPI